MKKIIIASLVLAVIMLLPEFAADLMAQTPVLPPATPTGSPVGGGATGVPIDGGLGFLLAAGVAYGGKKLKDRKQSKKPLNKTDV